MIFLLIYTIRSPFKTLNYLIVFLNIMYIWAEIKLAVWLSKWPQFALWNVLIACVIQSNPELCRAVQDAQGHGWCMLIGPSAGSNTLHAGKDAAWISKLPNSKERERREEMLLLHTKAFKKSSGFVMHVCSKFCWKTASVSALKGIYSCIVLQIQLLVITPALSHFLLKWRISTTKMNNIRKDPFKAAPSEAFLRNPFS